MVERDRCFRSAAKHSMCPQGFHRSMLNTHTNTGLRRPQVSHRQHLECLWCPDLTGEFQPTHAVKGAANEKARLWRVPGSWRAR